jgi:hypothetical protein
MINYFDCDLTCTVVDFDGINIIKIENVFDSNFNKLNSVISNNTFKLTPWNNEMTNTEVQYNLTYYVEVENENIMNDIDTISLSFRLNEDGCGIYTLSDFWFTYNLLIGIGGNVNSNICEVDFPKKF